MKFRQKCKRKIFPLLMVLLLLTGCAQNATDNDATENVSQSQTEQGHSGEETYVLTFEAHTIEGEPLTSECFARSKVTMVNVWATYCNPCLSEMPDLGEIAASYDESDFQIIGIVSDVLEDADEDEIENAKALIAETNANYPHLLLNQSLYSNLVGGVDSVPTTLFINQKGEALGYVVGAQSKEVWEEIINDLLAESE